MTVRMVRAGDLVRVPWKNGGGTTAEVAVFPEGAGFETFGWRVSLADVDADGPFSRFPGIDRTLVVMDGHGIELDVEGVPYRLDGASSRLSFSGDDATVGRLLGGPIRDLNVMTRRGRFRHRVRLVEAGVVLLWEGTFAALIVALDGMLDVTAHGRIHALRSLDTLVLEASQDIIQLAGDGHAVLIEIAPEVSSPGRGLSS